MKTWVDHVKAAIGREPIIYTGFYFWRDSVGGADITDLAAVARAVHERRVPEHRAAVGRLGVLAVHVDAARSRASAGNVDVDRWNGDMASLTGVPRPATPPAPCAHARPRAAA